MLLKKLLIPGTALLLLASCDKNDSKPGIIVAKESYILPGDTLFPEGIAYQPATGAFFTGSVTSGDIIKGDVQTGQAASWAAGAAQGRKAATGLRLDGKNHLWVCGGDDAKISVLDASGALLKMWDMKALFGAGFINDVTSDGTYMYFTDSRVQKIYRATIADVPSVMEEWLTFSNTQIPYEATGTNANGIVITGDNKYLIVVISTSGKLYRINITDKSIMEIPINDPVRNGDGMVLDGTKLYVSRNAMNMVYPVTLSAAFDNGTVGMPFGTNIKFGTTMAKIGNYLLIVNGQLDKRATRTQTTPFTLTRVSIP